MPFNNPFATIRVRFALGILLFCSALTVAAPATACSACDFFLKSTHRAGAYAVVIVLDRPTHEYPIGKMPMVTVIVHNRGKTRMYVDARTPIWEQTAYHINHVGYDGASEFDKPIKPGGGRPLLPGASYTFAPVSLTKWGAYYRAPGAYELALSYGMVDSAIVTFHMH